jgi:hypothetical protein
VGEKKRDECCQHYVGAGMCDDLVLTVRPEFARGREKLRIGHVTRALIKKAYALAQGDEDLAKSVSAEIALQHRAAQRGKSRLVRNELINQACGSLRPRLEEALKLYRAKPALPLLKIVQHTGLADWFQTFKPRLEITEMMILLAQPKVGAARLTYTVVAQLPGVTIVPAQVKRIREGLLRTRRR